NPAPLDSRSTRRSPCSCPPHRQCLAAAATARRNCRVSYLASTCGLLEIAPLAGLNKLIERLDLALKATIVPPVPVLRESERRYCTIETDAAVHGIFHGRVLVRQHRGELLNVRARGYVAMRRQDGVDVHHGDLVE